MDISTKIIVLLSVMVLLMIALLFAGVNYSFYISWFLIEPLKLLIIVGIASIAAVFIYTNLNWC